MDYNNLTLQYFNLEMAYDQVGSFYVAVYGRTFSLYENWSGQQEIILYTQPELAISAR